jgi:hypothetical protein
VIVQINLLVSAAAHRSPAEALVIVGAGPLQNAVLVAARMVQLPQLVCHKSVFSVAPLH